jgi:amino acid adenylation domain-containing protein
MLGFEDELAELTPAQRSLVERWLYEQAEAMAHPSAGHIPRRRATDVCPLSFDQQQLWFLYQWDTAGTAYNFPIAVRLYGPCDLAALAHSLNVIVQRHESLRTTFVAASGSPQQRFSAVVRIPLRRIDLDRLPVAVQDQQIAQLVRAEVAQPFDLEHGPLLRARALRLHATEHVLLITIHHIVFDNWSQGILIRELLTLYPAAQAGETAALPALPVQYGDYALWQRGKLHGRLLAEQLAFWTAQLRHAPALLDLPTDHPRPPSRSARGDSHIFGVAAAVTDGLNQLSRQSGATLFMTLLAAFAVLLYRYSGQTDIVIGTSIAGRSRAELEGLIGMFANRLALRTNLAGTPSFRELLQRVRTLALAAYEHQDIAFEQVLEALPLTRDMSRHPVFQVLLVLQNAPMPAVQRAGLTVQPIEVPRTTAQFDLGLFVREEEQELRGRVKYSTDLFTAPTMQRMFTQFQRLLAAIAADPDQPIDALPLLSVAERAQVLVAWNATAADYPAERGLAELVAAQAARTPAAVALVCATASLTYHELDRRANQLGQHLRALGVGPEVRVGVCLERTVELVVALLAVLKAGGAYVPLDRTYPAARLAFMLDDARVALLITDQRMDDGRWTEDEGADSSLAARQVVDLRADWPLIAHQPTSAPDGDTHPEQLAYVIYTSGSTGTPKGVMVTQRGVVNLLTALQHTLGLCAGDRLLALTTLAFDIAGLELYLPLLVGASVVIASREVARDGPQLAATVAAERVTVLQATPATWRMLLSISWAGQPGLLLLCGGEALAGPLAQALGAHGRALWNLYGPTETTIWSSAYRVPLPANGRPLPAALVPIGRPLANTTLYLLDHALRPVPIGVAGEVCIGGDGLARGYLGRPDLTAARFVPNPFVTTTDDRRPTTDDRARAPFVRRPPSSVRLYKTGDQARWRTDGTLEFLGRLDQQVKLRGFRIELGEVETMLAQHPLVRACVVLAREDAPGDGRLVAYVVPPNDEGRRTNDEDTDSSFVVGPSSVTDELRSFLKQRLPDYMIPTVFVVLDALPLTINGKVDRAALPAPERGGDASGYVAPRTPVEAVVAGIWTSILGLERVGVQSNFFDLGGHSLKAVRVLARIREIFRVEVPLRHLFEATTVAALAELIIAHEHAPGQSEKIAQLVRRIKAMPAADRHVPLESQSAE